MLTRIAVSIQQSGFIRSYWCIRTVYYAYGHPHILYGVEIYGNTCASYLEKLQKVNNKILRILQYKEAITA
jgi:hypothetical protein